MKIRRAVVCLFVLLAGYAEILQGQTATIPAIQASGSAPAPVWGTGIEQYNGFNGYLTLSAPLHHIGGRGEAGFDLVWNLQPGWVAGYLGKPNDFPYADPYPTGNSYGESTNTWGLGGPGAVYIRTGYNWKSCSNGAYVPSQSLTTLTFVMPNFGQVTLLDTSTNGGTIATPYDLCQNFAPATWDDNRGTSFRSIDGSQIQFNASSNVQEQWSNTHSYSVATVSGTLVFPSGVTYTVTNSVVTAITDRNGNQMLLTYGGPNTNIDLYLTVPALTQITDSLNRPTTINYSDSTCNGCLTVNWTGGGNIARQTQVLTGTLANNFRPASNYSIQTVGTLFSSSLFASINKYTPQVASAVILPDGTQYAFSYNSYGEVARVQLPTGGAIEYDYGPGSGTQGGYLSSSGGNLMIYRRLTERREYVSGGTGSTFTSRTTHTVTSPGGNLIDTVGVYDSSGNLLTSTAHTFQGLPTDSLTMTGTSCNNWNEGLEVQTTMSSSSTPGVTVANAYSNGGATNCISKITSTTKTTTLNDQNQQAMTAYTYDNYGNITEQKDYDWGAGAHGAAIRDISSEYLYQHTSGYAASTVNLVHLPYATYTKDGNLNPVAETDWRYDEYTPSDDPGILAHSSAYGTSFNVRGNVTSTYGWLNGSSSLVRSRLNFDIAGNVTLSSTADGQGISYMYTDGTNLFAFPTKATDTLGNASSAGYDYNAGQAVSVTDAANRTTIFSYADPFNRMLQRKDATNAQTNMTYPTGSQLNTTTAKYDKTTSGDGASLSATVTDGLGRIYEQLTLADSSHYIVNARTFDAAGRVNQTANPSLYTISPFQNSDGLNYATSYGYDALGRVTSVKTPDGNTTTTTYSGNNTDVVDPTNRDTRTATDALGRVTFVFEDFKGSMLQTQNTYNAAGSLTKVLKCSASGCSSGQTRTFTYDAMQRLTQAVNPESGTYQYSYTDGNGVSRLALQKRTDARGNTSLYGYDAMDRLKTITYNDGTPTASYMYDPTNLLTQSKNGNVTNNYTAFDGAGRVTASNVQMQGQTFTFGYHYDLSGNLTQETYPSGHVMNMTSDIVNRPQTESGVVSGTTTNYVQSAGYFPDGQVQFWQYGSNLWSWQTVDSMRRPWQAWATQNNNGNNWMFYDYYGFDTNSSVVSANEGFGTGVPFNSMTFMNDQYQYDGLKRLFKVTDTNYSRQYSWDEFGNLSLTQNSGVTLSGLTPYNNGTNPYNTANNHILGSNYGYDARGMMTKLGGITLGYNAEGQMTSNNESSTNLTWFYDAEGQRAQKLVSGTASVLYVHDAFGQLAAEYNTTSITPQCKVCYLTYDMLGTVRLITNESQGVVGRHDYLPFAEEIPDGTAGRSGNFGAVSNVTQGFTGQEADDVTGMNTASLHYFNARHLAGVLGTFVQPDPANAGADILRPQSWNAYAYVLGDPLGSVDPDGTTACTASNNYCGMNIFLPPTFGNPFSNYNEFSSLTMNQSSGTTGSQQSATIITSSFQDVTFDPIFDPVLLDLNGGYSAAVLKTKPAAPCSSNGSSSIVTFTATKALTEVGAFLGSAVGPEGTFVGAAVGSQFGLGGNISYVHSTHSIYVGVTALLAPFQIGGGGGFSLSYTPVPASQNANAIANGTSYGTAFQPYKFLGSAVSKSPGSGPPVVGYQVGTRSPVSYSASHNICLWNCGC